MEMVSFPIYVHIKSGEQYYKLSPARGQFDGVWYDGVAYKSANGYHNPDANKIYFRTNKDWEESFKLL